MWDVILWALQTGLKILAIFAAWMIIKYCIKNGGGAVRDLFGMAKMGIELGCIKLKDILDRKKGKEEEAPVE